MAVRILVDPNNPKDIAEVHSLQDAIEVSSDVRCKRHEWHVNASRAGPLALIMVNFLSAWRF